MNPTIIGESVPAPGAPAPGQGEVDTTPPAPGPAPAPEYGGREGPDPTRYGDWEKNGRCIDF